MFKRSWWLFLLIPSLLFALVSEKQVVVKEGKNRTWLGVKVEDISEKMLNDLKIPHGVKITEVSKDSPAAAAELKQDDIIIALEVPKRMQMLTFDRGFESSCQILGKRLIVLPSLATLRKSRAPEPQPS